MNLLPIVKKVEDHAEKIPPYEWTEENTPADIWEFHENIRTSSDDFWYCLENGYIDLSRITDTPEDQLTKKDIVKIEEIVQQYGIEF